MYHMKTVTVRDLRYDFKKVERLLRQGDEVQVTKRHTVIARLIPESSASHPLPDFRSRLRTIYGDQILTSTGTEVVSDDRDRY